MGGLESIKPVYEQGKALAELVVGGWSRRRTGSGRGIEQLIGNVGDQPISIDLPVGMGIDRRIGLVIDQRSADRNH